MSTHMPGFQSFFSVFASFCIGKISHHQPVVFYIIEPDIVGNISFIIIVHFELKRRNVNKKPSKNSLLNIFRRIQSF